MTELGALLLGLASLTGPVSLDEPLARWKLPESLSEISGLAVTPDGRVLAHDDEKAIVYELDVAAEQVVRRWKLRTGKHTLRGDFEGIAVRGGDVWLLTSSGGLLRAAIDSDVAPQAIDTGLGDECEFEGLAVKGDLLVMACKRVLDAVGTRLVLWDVAASQVAGRIHLDGPPLHLSAIEWCPRQNRFIGLAAREGQLILARADGRIESRVQLDAKRHPQAEGVTVHAGDLLIADEGRKRGRLMRYAWQPCR